MYQQFLEDRITRLENLFYSTIKLISEPNIKYVAQLETKLISGITNENGEAEIALPRLGDWEITIEDPAIGKRTRIIEANQLGTVFEVEIKFATLTIKTDEGNLVIATNGNYAISRLIDESETCGFKIGDGDWNIKYSNRVFYEIEQIKVKSTDSEIKLNFRAPAINISTTCDINVKITGGGKVIKDKVEAGDTYKFQAVYGAWQVEVKSEYGEEETYQAVLSKISGTLDIDFVSQYRVYGAKWDGSLGSKWIRTDMATNFEDPVPYKEEMSTAQYSSPFDNIAPWSEMTYGPEYDYNKMIKIPKFWYKISPYGNGGLRVQISNQLLNGFYVDPVHIDRGKGESSSIYIGKYHCGSDYHSKSGISPKINITKLASRNNIRTKNDFLNKNSGRVEQVDFTMRLTLWLLYIVEYADWDCKKTIGGSASGTIYKTGLTDIIPYHTGSVQKGAAKYRNIEGLWDNIYNWVEGCYYSDNKFYIILNPDEYEDFSNGIFVDTIPQGNYPIKFGIKNINNKIQIPVPIEMSENDQKEIGFVTRVNDIGSKNLYIGGSVYFEGMMNIAATGIENPYTKDYVGTRFMATFYH